MAKRKVIDKKHIVNVRQDHQARRLKRQEEAMPGQELASELISTVSHELRTPLTIIKEGIHLVKEGTLGPINPKQARALELGLNSTDRLIRLVSELLNISRLEKGKVKLKKDIIDMQELAEQVFRSFERLAANQGKFLSFEKTSLDEIVEIYGDADKLTQVLFNILQNALKHTNPGACITLNIFEDGSHCVIKIADQGQGIDKAELPKLFNKFYQVRGAEGNKREGLGLGLSIANEIVKLHGGKISVRSKKNFGTEFSIRLPAAGEKVALAVEIMMRKKLSKQRLKRLKQVGIVRLLIDMMSYSGFTISEKEELLESLQGLNLIKGALPDIWDHIDDFLNISLKDKQGRELRASNYGEALLMAYIEKNMGDFSYRDKPIHSYGATEKKRQALMSLVKGLSAAKLADQLDGLLID
ncbi:MAG: HAMP domain-containing sensor histidine kinase [bacterium]